MRASVVYESMDGNTAQQAAGPLVAGELERARQWGESLAASFPVPTS
ncbi:hypothetical protein [Nonomuraea salmonea]|uniref:Uncharacterized protein n=1 Tax=Nonomuraea salmonea TaxID=46181 RepID=A0ABV5NUS8_9ACTN